MIEEPEIIQLCGGEDGKHLVVSAAIHGNEKCGEKAIRRILKAVDNGDILLERGHVTFIPVSNQRAFDQDVRFIDRNLNRYMYPKNSPQAYEDHLDNVLCPIFRKAEALLDLHSFTAPGEAFIFLGPSRKEESDFAKALGVNNFMHGWQESYADDERDPLESQGTTEYTRLSGALALTLECGSHRDAESVEVAFQAILNALVHFDLALINPDLFEPRAVAHSDEKCVRLTEVFYKTGEGRFAQPWKNMDPVNKGELLATFNDGSAIEAPEDGFIIMPVEHEKVGEEWFHFGVKSDYFEQLNHNTLT